METTNSEDFKTKEKDTFELGLYNKKGYLNKMLIRGIGFWSFCFTWFSIVYMALISFLNLNDFFTIEWQMKFFHGFSLWLEWNLRQLYNGNFKDTINFIAYFSIALSLSTIFYIWFRRQIVKNAYIQSSLSSLGLENYYLTRFDKKKNEIYFKLIKGEKGNYDTFISKKADLKQLFSIGDFEIERFKVDSVKIRFLDEMLTIKTVENKFDFSKLVLNDRVLLGIKNNKPEPIYMTKKEEGLGLLNGNSLIVGGSGSGKSWLMEQLIKNYLTPENYKTIDKIYIINYKASADYNFMKGLNKVLYAEDIENGLKLLKMAYLDMICRYRFNSVNSQANFTQFQQLIIIDEVQTLNEMLDSKSLHRVLKNSISESLSFLEIMGSKIRASNGSLINILQKADVSSLPSTAYRSNLRNRIMLKQENISSAHLVVNSDIIESNNINPLELKQGQFIYWDMLTNELKRGFAVNNKIDFEKDTLNSLSFDSEVDKAIEECRNYKDISVKTIEILNKRMDALVDDGKKTFYDNFEDLDKNGEIDMFQLAKEELIKENASLPTKTENIKTPIKPPKQHEFSNFLKQNKRITNKKSSKEDEKEFLKSIK